MNRTSLLRGIVFSAIFLCGVMIYFSGSLWFFRALVSENSEQYIVGYYDSFLQPSSLLKSVQEKYAHLLPKEVNRYNRFVYKRDDTREYIVGIPKLLHQLSLARELRGQSFAVRRVGWLLLASRDLHANSEVHKESFNLFRSMRKAFGSVFVDGLPIRVQVIVQMEDKDSTSTALYVEENRNAIHAVINTQSSDFIVSKTRRLQKDLIQKEATFVALQGDTLPIIPSGFVTAVESRVSELMHFTKTRPKILQSLLAINKSVILSIEGSSVAVGVVSADDKTASLVQSWMDEEQGTRHPEKKAFSLPDKTIGYEYIPGKSDAHFSLIKSNSSCLPSEGYDESLFLCGKDDVLVVSNEEHKGSRLVTLLTDSSVSQRGVIQGGVLNAVGLASEFEKIEYATLGDSIDIWADVKNSK